jgi:hypothetical protein
VPSLFRTQTGSVTAELAVVLPSVMLVGAALIGGLVLGVQKVQVTYAAGSMARALARGEPIEPLAKQLGVSTRVEYLSDFACVIATAQTQPIMIEEKSCARKIGL